MHALMHVCVYVCVFVCVHLHAALLVGEADFDLAVQPTWAQQRRIQHVCVVV
jgi:hypothetical protein